MPARRMFKSKSAGCNLFSQKDEERCRIAMMGPAGVGKSSIINQFLYDNFQHDYKATVEELHRGEYDLDGVKLTLDILDTAGAHSFPAMRSLAIAMSNAFILVYSVDDPDSFTEISKLRDLIIEERGTDEVPIVVVANKADKNKCERAIPRATAETIVCVDWNNGFVEASAKDNENIVSIFKEMLRHSKLEYDLSPAVKRRRQSLSAVQGQQQKVSSPKLKAVVSKASSIKGFFSSQRSSV